MTYFATVEEWQARADKGTSGDMVHDILRDWRHDREKLLKKIQSLYDDMDRYSDPRAGYAG